MEIFDEIFSNNFLAADKILSSLSEAAMKSKDLQKILSEYNSTLKLSELKKMNLIDSDCGEYITNLECLSDIKRPLTNIELSWLKAVISDEKIHLFLDNNELKQIESLLSEVVPLYSEKDFSFFDRRSNGDKYDSEEYIGNFKKLARAIRNNLIAVVEYISKNGKKHIKKYAPYKLEYSGFDNRFRLIAFDCELKTIFILELSGIVNVEVTSDKYAPIDDNILENFEELYPIEIEIYDKRNAIERFMISFSNYHKETRYDKKRNCCITKLYYYKQDYKTIINNIISFGPAVKVLSPSFAVDEIVSKLKNQKKMFEAHQNS